MIKTLINKKDIPVDWPRCPECNQPLKSYSQHSHHNERFSLTTRTIFGWCDRCNKGCEISQFDKRDLWHTSGFRMFRKTRKGTNPGVWQEVAELPVPPVVIGPAKEFDTELCHAR